MTPHYDAHPMVLVRPEAVDADELRERLADAWHLSAPSALMARYRRGD